MTATLTETTPNVRDMNRDNVLRSYAGRAGCMCGCRGTYSEARTSVTTRRMNEVIRIAALDPESVKYYDFGSDGAWEWTKPNGNVVVIYVTKEN